MVRYKFIIKGVVQGVGFRPFIYKIAKELNLSGSVLNNSDGVVAEVEGDIKDIDIFQKKLTTNLPPLAKIDSIEKIQHSYRNSTAF